MSEQKPAMRLDPMPTPDSQFFWDAADKEMFMGQRCADCKTFMHPPGPMCPKCLSVKRENIELSGKGTIYSWVMPQHPKIPVFDYPLVTALIDLDEGIRFLSNIVDCTPEEVATGMRVEVTFVTTASGKKVPVFKPEGAAQ